VHRINLIIICLNDASLKAQKVYHGSLITIFFELMRQYNTYNRGIAEIIKNGIRYEIPLIDFEAYREAVANALIHEEVNCFLERLEERNLVESLEGSAFLSEAIRPKFADREQFILNILKEKGFILAGEETPTSASWRGIANPPFFLLIS